MRIIIVGGSMAGLFAAGLLRKAGHEVVVLERSSRGLAGRGAGLVAQPEVFSLLEALGREDVANVGVMARERITLDRAGAVIDRDPHPRMQISWDHLYEAMRGLIDERAYKTGRRVVAVGEDGDTPWVEIEDGSWLVADLVIGADGLGSVVRQAVINGPDPGPVYAGYVAWRALVPEAALPNLATEALSDRFAFFHMPGGQALGYTVAGPAGEVAPGHRRYNAVWYRWDEDPTATLTDAGGRSHRFSLPPGAVSEATRARLIADAQALLPPPFARVIAAEPRPFVQAIFDMETPRMARGGLALIGDAAFVARPHTAMGVAKAAGDALALADAVAQGWSPAARRAFERVRMAQGRAIVAHGRRLGASVR
jgi:2-polyprenyl-6-methoxyphenol hydroxylase-like FAD-dependent oxidoreductase